MTKEKQELLAELHRFIRTIDQDNPSHGGIDDDFEAGYSAGISWTLDELHTFLRELELANG